MAGGDFVVCQAFRLMWIASCVYWIACQTSVIQPALHIMYSVQCRFRWQYFEQRYRSLHLRVLVSATFSIGLVGKSLFVCWWVVFFCVCRFLFICNFIFSNLSNNSKQLCMDKRCGNMQCIPGPMTSHLANCKIWLLRRRCSWLPHTCCIRLFGITVIYLRWPSGKLGTTSNTAVTIYLATVPVPCLGWHYLVTEFPLLNISKHFHKTVVVLLADGRSNLGKWWRNYPLLQIHQTNLARLIR